MIPAPSSKNQGPDRPATGRCSEEDMAGWRHADRAGWKTQRPAVQLSARRVHVVDCMFRLPILSLGACFGAIGQTGRSSASPDASRPARPAKPSQPCSLLCKQLPPSSHSVADRRRLHLVAVLALSCCSSSINCRLPIDNLLPIAHRPPPELPNGAFLSSLVVTSVPAFAVEITLPRTLLLLLVAVPSSSFLRCPDPVDVSPAVSR